MRPVLFEIGLGGPDDDVEVHADVCVREPGGVVGAEADGVVARFVRGESEATVQRACGLDYDLARGLFLEESRLSKRSGRR